MCVQQFCEKPIFLVVDVKDKIVSQEALFLLPFFIFFKQPKGQVSFLWKDFVHM
jgi:hypothetical protein